MINQKEQLSKIMECHLLHVRKPYTDGTFYRDKDGNLIPTTYWLCAECHPKKIKELTNEKRIEEKSQGTS